MKVNLGKIVFISSTGETSILNCQHNLGNVILLRDCIKDLGVRIVCELYFHHLADLIFLHALKLLGIIRSIRFAFSTAVSTKMLYVAFERSKLDFFLVFETLIITDCKKLT
jgi:hypothetical protein